LPPTYYRGCWHVVSRGFFVGYRQTSSPTKGLYDPKAFITHAALLRQASAHCAKFLAAASRRSLGRVSVPVWLSGLSAQLPITALVGPYPTNQLIGRTPLPMRHPRRRTFLARASPRPTCGISGPFGPVSPTFGQVTYVLLTRPPLHRLRRAGAVRLACVRHAASVYPEPGSNSPTKPLPPASSPAAGRWQIYPAAPAPCPLLAHPLTTQHQHTVTGLLLLRCLPATL
jgi:hypothetical protein